MRAAVQLLALMIVIVWAAEPVPAAKSGTKKATPKPQGGFSGATPKPGSSSGQTTKPFVTPRPSQSSAATPKARATPSAKMSGKAKRQETVADDDGPAGEKSPTQSAETKSLTSAKTGSPAGSKSEKSAATTNDAPEKSSPSVEPAPGTKAPNDSENLSAQRKDGKAPNATIGTEDLVEFAAQPARVQQLIDGALALTRQQLNYAYGSADPAKGGMDCSGTIYYLLRAHGFKDVPRDSPGQYMWARKSGGFRAVVSNSSTSFEFDELLPGDLMFWSGTYNIKREMPVTHVMLYLGTQKKGGKRVMFGASDGRTYDGVQRWGVSVFDFKMPRNDAEKPRTDFLGYARIPGLRTEPPAPIATNVSDPDAVPKPAIGADSTADEEKPRAKIETAKKPGATTKKKTSASSAARKTRK